MSVTTIYDDFTDFFMKLIQKYSKDGLVLAYNCLYLTEGLIKSPVEVRNKVIDDICSMSIESIFHTFQLTKIPNLYFKKLVKFINDIKNKNVNI